MLQVSELEKTFGGVPVVADLSFDVDSSEVVALVGVNGAGKTTTLRCIVGVEPRDSGDVLLHGVPLDERDAATRRKVCALLDDSAVFPDTTVLEHLQVFASAHRQDPSVCTSALEELEIAHLADRLPVSLSSGQSQRFKLAQALVRPWDLLILDEPEQRLDVDGREWLGKYLSQQAQQGRSILMASHDPALRAASGARVVSMDAL